MTKDHDGKISSIIAFDLEYIGASGSKHKDTVVIDMAEYKGAYRLGTPHLYSIAQSLEKLEKTIGQIASGFKRLRADVYTSTDRALEHEEMKKQREERCKHRDDV